METRVAIRCGLTSVLTLVGCMALGIAIGNVLFESLPGHMNEPSRIGMSAVPTLAGIFGGGALWGWSMARLAHAGHERRMAWAGLFGYSVPVFIAMFLLLAVEGAVVEYFNGIGRAGVPIHIVFTLLFVPTAFLIAAIGTGALGIALRDSPLAWRMALSAGIAAALAFLVMVLIMNALGWRVGAPGAAERFTMITVLMVGNMGAALAGGSVTGVLLARREGAESTSVPAAGAIGPAVQIGD